MYEFLSTKTALFLQKYVEPKENQTKEEQFALYKYGVHSILINVLKTTLLLVFTLYFDVFNFVLSFAMIYGSLRFFSYGVHIKNTALCTLVSLVYYLGSTYLAKNYAVHPVISLLIIPICAVAFFFYAPASYRTTPIKKSRQKHLKIMSFICLAIWYCFVIYTIYTKQHGGTNIINLAVICQTINILPITFRLLKEKKS